MDTFAIAVCSTVVTLRQKTQNSFDLRLRVADVLQNMSHSSSERVTEHVG